MAKKRLYEDDPTHGTPKPSRWADVTEPHPTTRVKWEQVTGSLIWELIAVATAEGDAVMLGASRDGGTLVLTVMSGNERPKFYATTAQAMDAHLTNIIDRYR
jgi:hypothetical protein